MGTVRCVYHYDLTRRQAIVDFSEERALNPERSAVRAIEVPRDQVPWLRKN